MVWQFLKTQKLTDQWQTTDWVPGNLFKLDHDCSLPSQYSWSYTGLIGQVLLDADSNSQLYGEMQRLYFFPNSQYFLFNPLEDIDLRKLAIKGYWSKQTTFNWNVDIYVWDQVLSQNGFDFSKVVDLTELTNLNNQQLTILNQQSILLSQINNKSNQIISDINNLTFGGGNAGGNGNGIGSGNPNLGI